MERRWRRKLAGVGGDGGGALGRGRRRCCSSSPDERKAAPGAARRGRAMEAAASSRSSWSCVDTRAEPRVLRRPRVAHGLVVLAPNKSREKSESCARTKQRRWDRGESTRWSSFTGTRGKHRRRWRSPGTRGKVSTRVLVEMVARGEAEHRMSTLEEQMQQMMQQMNQMQQKM